MLLQLATTLVTWLVLLFVTTNLIGFLVRGVFSAFEAEGDDVLKGVIRQHRTTEHALNLVGLVFVILFFLALYHFWNAGVVAAAMMLMAARLPDLIWEVKHGTKLQLKDARRPALWKITTALSWVSLPLLWYALYRM